MTLSSTEPTKLLLSDISSTLPQNTAVKRPSGLLPKSGIQKLELELETTVEKVGRAWRGHLALLTDLEDAQYIQELPHHEMLRWTHSSHSQIVEAAIHDYKEIQKSESKVLAIVDDHFKMAQANLIVRDSGSEDCDDLSALPTVSSVMKTIYGDAYLKRLNDVVAQAIKARTLSRINYEVLVFTAIGDKRTGTLPCYTVKKNSELSPYVLCGGVYFTAAAYHDFMCMEKELTCNEAQLDLVVQALAKNELFSWNFIQEGCNQRSKLIVCLLILMGIPEQSLKKCFAFTKEPFALDDHFGNKTGWDFHTAIQIMLDDGGVRIIDPTLEPTRSLCPIEWVKKLHPQYNPSTDYRGHKTTQRINYGTSVCVSYVANLDQEVSKDKAPFIRLWHPPIKSNKGRIKSLACLQYVLEIDLLSQMLF
ncbi:MAG: protein-glutamine glutaminase family protein [Parachlamydiaceae bacterium]